MELSLSDGSMLLLVPGGGGAVDAVWEACLADLSPISPHLSPSLAPRGKRAPARAPRNDSRVTRVVNATGAL